MRVHTYAGRCLWFYLPYFLPSSLLCSFVAEDKRISSVDDIWTICRQLHLIKWVYKEAEAPKVNPSVYCTHIHKHTLSMTESAQKHNLPECITVKFDQTVPLTLVKPGGPTLVTLLIYVLDCCVTSTVIELCTLDLVIFCLLTRVKCFHPLTKRCDLTGTHFEAKMCQCVFQWWMFEGRGEKRLAESDEAPAWREDTGRVLNHVLSTITASKRALTQHFLSPWTCLLTLFGPSVSVLSSDNMLVEGQLRWCPAVAAWQDTTSCLEIVWKCHILLQQRKEVHSFLLSVTASSLIRHITPCSRTAPSRHFTKYCILSYHKGFTTQLKCAQLQIRTGAAYILLRN